MAKDYAKLAARSKRKKGKQKSHGMYFIIFLMLGLLGLIYLNSIYHQKHLSSHAHLHKSRHAQLQSKPQTPKFDFYTMLPKMRVGTTEPNIDASDRKPKSSALNKTKSNDNKKVNSSNRYYIQMAAFREFAEADKLKARLLLQGYNARIQTAVGHHVSWQKVLIGPYKNLQYAEKIRAQVSDQKHKTMIVQGTDLK